MRATETGRQLAQDVRTTLDALSAAVDRVRGGDGGNSITVSVLPSFAAAWLVTRLGGFLERHPQVELRLESTTALADFRNDGVDVAIRYGAGNWEGLDCVKLFDDEVFPTLSPKLRRSARIKNPADLARGSLASAKLRAGVLVAPFKQRIASPQTCFLVYPPTHARKPAVQLFRDWLLEELQATPPVRNPNATGRSPSAPKAKDGREGPAEAKDGRDAGSAK